MERIGYALVDVEETNSALASERSQLRRVLAGLSRRPTALLGAAILLAVVASAVFAPQLAPHDPLQQALLARMKPPGWDPAGDWSHPLGTDNLGRDILSRLLYGARVSLFVGITTVSITAVLGGIIGLLAGYFGGYLDDIVMRVVDMWMAFPNLLLALAFSAALGPGLGNLVIALVLSTWVIYCRIVRAEVLSLRESEYVQAARAIGAGHLTIMFRHIFPNVIPALLVTSTLQMGVVIITEASLSFLGLGVQASTVTWGGMLADGRRYLRYAWWLTAFPGAAISLVVLAINLLGDGLRDALDPRLRSER